VACYVFGFGNDHNSAHLRLISSAASGPFVYVEQSEAVTEAFGGALGAALGTCARDVTLRINIPSEAGCTITQVFSGQYEQELTSLGDAVEVRYKDLMYGETRDVLVTVLLKESANEGPECLFHTSCTFHAPCSLTRAEDGSWQGQADPQTQAGEDCCVMRRAGVDTRDVEIHVDVDAQVSSFNDMW
jgi:hypothetical protein